MNDENDKKDPTIKPLFLEGHKPKTRRDFLAQGFLGMSAFALAPSALSLLSSNAYAADCAAPQFTGLTPVIVIDLVGGGSLAGSNIIVGGQGGQEDFLPSYETLGLPQDFHPKNANRTNNEMGLMFHSDSGILRGMQTTALMPTRLNTEGAFFCSSTDDDTSNNQINPMYWLNKAGAKGEIIQLAGFSNSKSGGNSMAPEESVNPAVAPVRIESAQQARNLVGLGSRLGTYSSSKVDSMLNSAARLSENKINKIPRRSLPDTIKALVGCSFFQTQEQVAKISPDLIDPSLDNVLTQAFSRMTNRGLANRVSPITKLVVDGYVGAGTINLGGYDYHTGNRQEGEIKDFELGQVIGSILEYAASRNKDLVIYVITDGGVSANTTIDMSQNGRGKFGWAGDSGQRSGALMLVYKKDGKAFLRERNKRQIGYYKSTGSVENTALLTSNSVINLSKAMVANYLALHGDEGKLADVVGEDPFRNNLDKYLVFDKLR